MREILFRGKRTDTGAWITGDIVHDYWIGGEQFLGTAIRYPTNGIYSFPISVDESTVGQYTGLKDKNGTMIFEGDIVGFDEFPGSHHRIYFDVDNARWTDERIEDGDTCTDYYGFDFVRDSTVIGNIHDNPELIKS